eukprot:1148038-Pelagomonas_calceolata.AAC.6
MVLGLGAHCWCKDPESVIYRTREVSVKRCVWIMQEQMVPEVGGALLVSGSKRCCLPHKETKLEEHHALGSCNSRKCIWGRTTGIKAKMLLTMGRVQTCINVLKPVQQQNQRCHHIRDS